MLYDHTQRIEIDEHLAIRPYTQDDVEGMFPRLTNEKAELFMIASIDNMQDISDLRIQIDRGNGLLREGKRLGGAIELGSRIVGTCRISHIRYGEDGDLGYWLFKEARGKGLVTRCSAALLDIVFSKLNLQRVTIGAAPSNERSVAVAKRLGFEFQQVNEKVLFRGGQWWDAAIYAMSCQRWTDLKAN